VKKIVSVIVVFVLLVATVVLEQVFIDRTLSSLNEKIDFLDKTIDATEAINTTEIKNIIDDLDSFWTEKEKVLCISINHNDLNRVGEQIKKIKVYIEQNNKDDCVYEIKVLKFYAESYDHTLELNPQNVL